MIAINEGISRKKKKKYFNCVFLKFWRRLWDFQILYYLTVWKQSESFPEPSNQNHNRRHQVHANYWSPGLYWATNLLNLNRSSKILTQTEKFQTSDEKQYESTAQKSTNVRFFAKRFKNLNSLSQMIFSRPYLRKL